MSNEPGTPHRKPATVATALAAAVVLGCAAAPSVGATEQAFKPDDQSCRHATPEQLAWLPGNAWKTLASAVRVCSVRRDVKAPTGLLIASVWEDDYYATQPNGSTMIEMPPAQLLAPDGRRLGELPKNFPADEAATVKLSFSDWRGNLPAEIRVCVLSPAVAGNYVLPPLRLNAAGDHYGADVGQPSPPTKKDDCHGQ
jgi:hypothetical protein